MNKFLAGGAALIVCGLLVPAGAQGATSTKVQIGGYGFNGPGNGGQFQIEVKSQKLSCKKNRKVTLYRDEAGGPVKIGASKTISGEGTWVAIIDDPDDPTADPYYASVSKDGGCAKDKSKNYFIPTRRKAKTNLTIQENNGTFFGQAKSSKGSCENGRTVTLYLKQPGKDEKVDTDKTGPGKGDTEGVWVINVEIIVVGGNYYAKVKSKGDCDGDKSKTVVAEP